MIETSAPEEGNEGRRRLGVSQASIRPTLGRSPRITQNLKAPFRRDCCDGDTDKQVGLGLPGPCHEPAGEQKPAV